LDLDYLWSAASLTRDADTIDPRLSVALVGVHCIRIIAGSLYFRIPFPTRALAIYHLPWNEEGRDGTSWMLDLTRKVVHHIFPTRIGNMGMGFEPRLYIPGATMVTIVFTEFDAASGPAMTPRFGSRRASGSRCVCGGRMSGTTPRARRRRRPL
jgi:hypothetical protein